MTTMVVMLRFAVQSILHSLVLMVSALVINLSAESNHHAQSNFHIDVSTELVPSQLPNVIQNPSAQPVSHFSVPLVSVPNMLSSVILLVYRPAQKANHSFALLASALSPHFTVCHFIREMVNPISKVNNIQTGTSVVTPSDHIYVVTDLAEKSKTTAQHLPVAKTSTSHSFVKMVSVVPPKKNVTLDSNSSVNVSKAPQDAKMEFAESTAHISMVALKIDL
jgi:hypothetical protein